MTTPNPPGDGPCEVWPVEDGCCDGLSPDPTTWTPAQQTGVQIASDLLWRLTAGVYGLCREVVRPCRDTCEQFRSPWSIFPGPIAAGGLLQPLLVDGQWFNAGCGCAHDCSCTTLCKVTLPGPVHAISAVTVDGVPVPSTGWVLYGNQLVATGGDCWPLCQDLTKPSTEAGTFEVDYQRGVPVPPLGVRAHTELACEMAKGCTPDGACPLPGTVTAVDREGVTYTLADPDAFLASPLLGLPSVQLFLSAVNPNGLREQAAVYSPDFGHTPAVTPRPAWVPPSPGGTYG